MGQSIGFQPGAAKFRSIAAIILILIFIGSFLGYSHALTTRVDRAARDRVISEIRQGLAMLLYAYAIKGRLADLQSLDQQNPFSLIAAYRPLPSEYKGARSRLQKNPPAGWYYDLTMRQVIWVALDGQHQVFVLRFAYDDVNGNKRFDPELDLVVGLVMKKAS